MQAFLDRHGLRVQAVRADGLEDVVQRRRLEGPHGVLGVGGDEDDRRAVAAVRQLGGHLHARGAGHLDVQEERIHLPRHTQPGQHRRAVLQLRPHLAAGLPEEPRQPGPGQGLVIGQGHLERPHRRVSRRGRATSATVCGPSERRLTAAPAP